MTASTSFVREAVQAGDYERAALRLLMGLLVALEETSPETREELIAWLDTPRRRDRGER